MQPNKPNQRSYHTIMSKYSDDGAWNVLGVYVTPAQAQKLADGMRKAGAIRVLINYAYAYKYKGKRPI